MRIMRRIIFISPLFLSAVLGFAGACTQQAPPSPAAPPFRPTVPTLELMHHVVMPAADQIWSQLGTIINAKETIELYPKTEDDWMRMENGAVLLSEVGNLLMIPGYAPKGDAEWIKAAVGLRDIGESMLKAVQSKNKEQIENVAGQIDATCDVCHDKYQTTEVPNPAEAPLAAPAPPTK